MIRILLLLILLPFGLFAQFPGQKLPGDNYARVRFKTAGTDTLWKFYYKEHRASDTLLQVEVFRAKKLWKVYQYRTLDGKRSISGDQFEYDEKGRLISVLHCQSGQKKCPHFTAFNWWGNDTLNKQGDFMNGKPIGEHRSWYDNGQLRSVTRYNQEGLLQEVSSLFDIAGNPLDRGDLNQGNGTVFIYSMNGVLLEERFYVAGKVKKKRRVIR